MRREELEELHFIAPIANIASIMQHGILSHTRAQRQTHVSFAMPEILALRAGKRVPGGRPLFEYANLYFHARNPTLLKRKDQHLELCVIRVDPNVLDLPGVVVTDSNAAGKYVRFGPAATGLANVSRDLTFSRDWRDPDRISYFRRKAAKCAEVLVPDRVLPELLTGVYVSEETSRAAFEAVGTRLTATVDADLFFR